MTDVDVIAKLSRILETHSFGGESEKSAESFLESSELGKFIKSATRPETVQINGDSPKKLVGVDVPTTGAVSGGVSPKRTPFEMWQNKQKSSGKLKEQPKSKTMTENQKDHLVQQLFKKNRHKEM